MRHTSSRETHKAWTQSSDAVGQIPTQSVSAPFECISWEQRDHVNRHLSGIQRFNCQHGIINRSISFKGSSLLAPAISGFKLSRTQLFPI